MSSQKRKNPQRKHSISYFFQKVSLVAEGKKEVGAAVFKKCPHKKCSVRSRKFADIIFRKLVDLGFENVVAKPLGKRLLA